MRVAYLLTVFPVVSETFILNEIVEAKHQGVDVRVFSEIKPKVECPHAKMHELDGRLEYLPSLDSLGYLRTIFLHGKFFLRRPFCYIRTLKYALRHRKDAMLWAFKFCVHFAEPLSRFKPHIIHTHFASHTARFSLLISRILGIPYVLTIHGWYDLYKAPPPYMRELIMCAIKTVTVCEYNKKYIEKEYNVPSEKVAVVKCGISVDAFLPGQGSEKEEGLILSVGRLHYHKAYHHLIDSCKILRDRGISFKCWIIGDGELRVDLQRRIDDYGLGDKVVLLGMKSNEEVSHYLRKAQIFALSSEVEIVPIVFMEAMASQLPVVATAVFGVPELVEQGKTGLLCKTGNPEAMADHLIFLLDKYEERRSMGIEGRKKIMREHELSTQVAKLVSIWTSGSSS